jgi:hypothetical protein
MNRFTRLVSLLSLSAFVVAGSLVALPSTANAKTTMVKAHTMKTKSGKIVLVKSHKMTVKPKTKIKVKGYTKVTKTGKVVHVKGYTRKAPKMKPMGKMKM